MTQVRAELEAFFQQFPQFALNALIAFGLLVGGLAVARFVSEYVRKRVDRSSIGVAANRNAASPDSPSLGKSLGSATFWIIFLLFIPWILTYLGLAERLAPLNNMVTTVLNYMPRVIGAGLILAIGFVIATAAQRAVTSLLSAAPIDHAAKRADIGDLIKGKEIARALGLIAYVGILIPTFIIALEALAIASISQPLTSMLETMLGAIPSIIAAVLVLFVFTLFARAVKSLVISVLTGVGFDRFWEELGLAIDQNPESAARPARRAGFTPTLIVANIAMAAMLIVGAITAAQQLNIEPVSTALTEILAVGGRIMLGSIVIIVGIPVARFVGSLIRRTGDPRSEFTATAVVWGILVLVTAIGIREMGLGEDIIYAGFVIILGSVSLAAAIAFGIGGRGAAARFLERLDRDPE